MEGMKVFSLLFVFTIVTFPELTGQMTALQTLDEHKKKGYASLVISSMCKYLAEQHLDCCGTVMTWNRASEALFTKLGFTVLYKCFYLVVRETTE